MNRLEARKVIAEFKDYKHIGMRLRDIATWHANRNLLDGSNDKTQFMKLIQEVGELSDSLCKGKDIRDDVGDIMVVLVNICIRNNVSFISCLDAAYNDIKDRKGIMYNNIFVKSTDPSYLTICKQYYAEVGMLPPEDNMPDADADEDNEDEAVLKQGASNA
jgi:hypothetical protein